MVPMLLDILDWPTMEGGEEIWPTMEGGEEMVPMDNGVEVVDVTEDNVAVSDDELVAGSFSELLLEPPKENPPLLASYEGGSVEVDVILLPRLKGKPPTVDAVVVDGLSEDAGATDARDCMLLEIDF